MSTSLLGDSTPPKGRLSKKQREQAAIALSVAGFTQQQIANELGLERKAVGRYLADAKPSKDAAETILQRAQSTLEKVWPVEKRIERVAVLGENAKNEACQLEAVRYANDLAGIVTEKELVRSKRNEPASPQAMFMLPPGTSISFSATTVDNKNVEASSDKVSSVIDVELDRQ